MTQKLADYVRAGYLLTPQERLEAARMFRLSVDPDSDGDPVEIEAAWLNAIGSRVDEVLTGSVQLVDAEETYRMLSSELASKRQ